MLFPVIIGGSAGSYKILIKLLAALPVNFHFPIIICVHRPKVSDQSFITALENRSKAEIKEITQHEPIKSGIVYVTPSDVHLEFKDKNTFYLSTEMPVNHSRPSIDHCLKSAANTFKTKLIAIILTGANSDGAEGMKSVHNAGAITIVQTPSDAEIPIMPKSALNTFLPSYVLKAEEIINFIKKLATN